jgi:hypothetical protein
MLIGLVGKPSVGKSTFFKAATLAEVAIASYPFTTIKPNRGVGYVRIECIDKEFGVQCNPSHGFCINHERFVPVELMDVAGLVPGASEGKGLGNQFLDDLRQADVFIQIVDVSGTTDIEGKQTEGYDVSKDIGFLEDELNKWFFGILIKAWKSFSRQAEMEDKDFAESVAKQFSGLKVNKEQVKDVLNSLSFIDKRPSTWTNEQLMEFAAGIRKKSKPMIIAANKIDMPEGKKNLELLMKKFPGLKIIPCSADSELALREAAKIGLIDYIPGDADFRIKGSLNGKQLEALNKIKKDILEIYHGTGVQEILNFAVFELLKYIAIFPAGATKLADSKGRILPDCFLLPPGSTALDFAYHLHTDFGKNFIKAIHAKTKRILGKDYALKNRDALEIITR